MNRKLLLLAGLYFLTLGAASAQAKKISGDVLIWPELQADYYLANQSFFFFRNQYRHNTNSDIVGLKENGALSNLYQIFFLAGYDQKFTDHWRGAISARYTFNRNSIQVRNNNQIYQARLQHNGKIGQTDFIKRVAYDLMRFEEGNSRGRIRPVAALERSFGVGKFTLRPHVSYELFFYNDFNDEASTVETRTVDRTRLRLAAGFRVSDQWWVTPFFTRQTDYFNVLSTFTVERDANGNIVYDADGNEVLIENKGGKRNRIEPIFGLEIRYLMPHKNVNRNTVPNFGSRSETEAD